MRTDGAIAIVERPLRHLSSKKGEPMAGKSRRTVLYSSKGKKLYAVRDASGKFKDIQQYSRAHAMDMRRKSKVEVEVVAKKAVKKTTRKKPPAKKPAVKKTTAKKTAVKRTAAKKPVARKSAAKKTTVKKAAGKSTARKTAAKTSVGKSLKSMVKTAVGRVRKAEGAVERAVKRAVRKVTA
jgi:hypothetical protein